MKALSKGQLFKVALSCTPIALILSGCISSRKPLVTCGEFPTTAAATKQQLENDIEKRASALSIASSKTMSELGVISVPDLIFRLYDSDPFIRTNAALSLGRMGPSAKEAVPHLLVMHKTSRASIDANGVNALGLMGKYGEKSVIPHIVLLLQDEDSIFRDDGAIALKVMGPESQSAVPYIVPLLKSPERTVRRSAAFALGFMGQSAQSAIPNLIPLLQDTDLSVSATATHSLNQLVVSHG
jgi:HEAT repeat protein